MFKFTESGMSAPPYIAVSGPTPDKLPIEDCPDGIISEHMKKLYKGGDDLQNNGFG